MKFNFLAFLLISKWLKLMKFRLIPLRKLHLQLTYLILRKNNRFEQIIAYVVQFSYPANHIQEGSQHPTF